MSSLLNQSSYRAVNKRGTPVDGNFSDFVSYTFILPYSYIAIVKSLAIYQFPELIGSDDSNQ
jgi:hypothetical protein